jgi:hypothetical protein
LIFHRSVLAWILAQFFMSRVKKKLAALAVLFSLEFLFLGLFTNGTFSWTRQYIPPLLKEALHTDASVVKLDSPAQTDGGFVFERYGEVTPRSEFLAAKETAEVFLQSFIVVPLSFRFILAPKVSRYLSKSVLIL